MSEHRTITLTGRPPVRIADADWPSIAEASYHHYDGQYDFQSFRHWRAWLRVRQHADGRGIVYGRVWHETAWEGEAGYSYRAGRLLSAGADVAAALHEVAAELSERGADVPEGDQDIGDLAHEAVASLPPEPLA